MPPSKADQEMLRSEQPYRMEQIDNKEPSLQDIPEYRVSIDLSDAQKERLTSQFKAEFESLQDERRALGLEARWDELDRQYNGELKPNKKLAFNLHCHQTKVKEDAVVRALNEAFLDSDPIVDVSPRPEMLKQGAQDICEKQAQFIDYEMDENIRPAASFVMINHSAFRKYVGIGKLEWDYRKERRKREEVYDGKNEPMVKDGQPVIGADGMPVIENIALKEFLSTYPDGAEKYPGLVKKISEGKKVSVVVEYMDTVANNAKFRYIRLQDFWVANSTRGLSGLKKAHLIVERQNYRWHELEEKEANEEFVNIDQIGTGEDKELKDYTVYEATTYFRMNEGDKEETKLKAWFGEVAPKDKKDSTAVKDYVLLGQVLYPYFAFDTDYIPFYIKLNDEGFFGGAKSVALDLRDSNIAQDVILNMMLDGGIKRNILTPIVREGSEIEQQFIENRWFDGKPLSVDGNFDDVNKGIGFVQYPQQNFSELVGISQMLKKMDGDVTGVSEMMTGRESQSDPRAPATKTIALLNQSGINIKDYIRTYLPSFNEFVGNILGLYYQMSTEGRPYKIGVRAKRVTGDNPFINITRDAMVARTNIQARASAFAFDKINEKNENMAALQLIQANPYLMQNPRVQYEAVKIALASWNPLWKNFADNKIPSPEEFAQEMQQAAMQAIMQVMAMKQQATGMEQPPEPGEASQIAHQAQMQAYNPMLGQEKK